MWTGGSMGKYFETPIKAIRKKCLDCSYWSTKEVRECPVINCAIYSYRFGRRPDKTTVNNIKKFSGKNIEPIQGF